MFRFTIRDVMWLMVVVALGVGWYRQSSLWKADEQSLIQQHEAALANERRIGELRAKEAVENALMRYTRPRITPAEQLRAARNGLIDEEPTPTRPLTN
jgi:hypothetical protein